jgi:hypothetical protein
MRAVTPVLTDPNYIRPSNDSRKALVAESPSGNQPLSKNPKTSATAPVQKKNSKTILTPTTGSTNLAPKRKRREVIEIEDDSALNPGSKPGTGSVDVMDLTQDSDSENAKVEKKPKRKSKYAGSEFDEVEEYFHAPTFANEDVIIFNSASSHWFIPNSLTQSIVFSLLSLGLHSTGFRAIDVQMSLVSQYLQEGTWYPGQLIQASGWGFTPRCLFRP